MNDLKKLLNNIPPGAKITIETPDGEAIVETTPTKDDLLDKSLIGLPITVTEAAEKYNLNRQTVWEWKKSGYVAVLKDGYRAELDEADIAYCAEIYHSKNGVKGVPLFDENGLPYELKHPKLSEYRKQRA